MAIEHQWFLKEASGKEVPIQKAAEQFAGGYARPSVKRRFNWLKRRGKDQG